MTQPIRKMRFAPPTKRNPFTKIVAILVMLAAGIMLYLYLAYRNSPIDAEWANYALMMMIFALSGYAGKLMLDGLPLFTTEFTSIDLNTGVRAILILGACIITQLVAQVALSFTSTEQVLYFVFAAVCEEIFFRVLVISMILKIKDDLPTKVTAVIVQAIMFVAIHQNYYANFPMLVSVFIGGMILGIFYVVWRDATANILAHFLLNLLAVRNLTIVLGASGDLPLLFSGLFSGLLMAVCLGLVLLYHKPVTPWVKIGKWISICSILILGWVVVVNSGLVLPLPPHPSP